MHIKPSGILTFTRMADDKPHIEIEEEYAKKRDNLDKKIEDKIIKILKEKGLT